MEKGREEEEDCDEESFTWRLTFGRRASQETRFRNRAQPTESVNTGRKNCSLRLCVHSSAFFWFVVGQRILRFAFEAPL